MTVMEFVKNNWLKIIIGIVVLIILLNTLKTVNQLVNCSGPICKGIGNVLGTAANVINGVTSGCSPQADCSKFTDSNSCVNGNGCSWSSEATAGTCVSTTGLKAGDGGFFTTSCALGMGFIAFLIASLLAPLLRAIISRTGVKSENAKAESILTGKTINEVITDLAKKVRELSERAVEKLRGEKTIKITDSVIETTASYVASNEALNRATLAAEGQTQATPAERAQNMAKAVEFAAAERQLIEKNAMNEAKLSEVQNEAAKGAADSETVPSAERTIARVKAFHDLNQVPSKSAHELLTQHVEHHQKKGDYIPVQHINFLKSVKPT